MTNVALDSDKTSAFIGPNKGIMV